MFIDEIKCKRDIELWVNDKLYESMPIEGIIKCAERRLTEKDVDYVKWLLRNKGGK